jgi:arginyl-tRNA synthetase
MSGRRGYGVKADDLLNVLEKRGATEVAKRNPELDAAEVDELGRQIAVGALRYFLVKFSRNKVIAFDLEEALSFEGETGPYLQYAGVRAHSIFAKLEERWGKSEEEVVSEARSMLAAGRLGSELVGKEASELWNLIVQLMRLEYVIGQTVTNLEISTLAKHAFGLAQAFNHFYHRYPILKEENEAKRALRILLAHVFRLHFSEVLSLLGIPLPERM